MSTARTPAWPVKAVAVFLAAATFLVNGVFSHAQESAFWVHRRRAAAQAAPSLTLAQLPPAGPALRVLPAHSALGAIGKNHAPLLAALSSRIGTVRKIQPTAAGAPLVIHIQDVHQNAEAQANIRDAVAALAATGKIKTLALEGAFGPMDLSRYQNFVDREVVGKIADYLLGAHEISGPVHAGLTARSFPAVTGIDDPSLHAANAQAYRRSAGRMEVYGRRLAGAAASLEKEKAREFNARLLAADRLAADFGAGRASLGAYLKGLAGFGGQGFPQVGRFLETLAQEESMDFAAVDRERAALTEALAARMSPARAKAFVQEALAYRAGALSYAEFYGRLRALCQTHGLPLSGFPRMDAYVRYVLAADAIDGEKLWEEAARLEDDVYRRLAATPREKELVAQSRRLALASKLVRFALTPEDWKRWRADPAAGDLDLSSFEDFYRRADDRDAAMAENVRRLEGPVVLVTGGYHAGGIAARLKDSGVAVVSFTPKIEKLDDAQGAAYLSVFSREKTPLEKRFDGPTLYLAAHPGRPSALARGAAVGVGLYEARGAGRFTAAQKTFDALAPGSAKVSSRDLADGAARVDVEMPEGSLRLEVRDAAGAPAVRPARPSAFESARRRLAGVGPDFRVFLSRLVDGARPAAAPLPFGRSLLGRGGKGPKNRAAVWSAVLVGLPLAVWAAGLFVGDGGAVTAAGILGGLAVTVDPRWSRHYAVSVLSAKVKPWQDRLGRAGVKTLLIGVGGDKAAPGISREGRDAYLWMPPSVPPDRIDGLMARLLEGLARPVPPAKPGRPVHMVLVRHKSPADARSAIARLERVFRRLGDKQTLGLVIDFASYHRDVANPEVDALVGPGLDEDDAAAAFSAAFAEKLIPFQIDRQMRGAYFGDAVRRGDAERIRRSGGMGPFLEPILLWAASKGGRARISLERMSAPAAYYQLRYERRGRVELRPPSTGADEAYLAALERWYYLGMLSYARSLFLRNVGVARAERTTFPESTLALMFGFAHLYGLRGAQSTAAVESLTRTLRPRLNALELLFSRTMGRMEAWYRARLPPGPPDAATLEALLAQAPPLDDIRHEIDRKIILHHLGQEWERRLGPVADWDAAAEFWMPVLDFSESLAPSALRRWTLAFIGGDQAAAGQFLAWASAHADQRLLPTLRRVFDAPPPPAGAMEWLRRLAYPRFSPAQYRLHAWEIETPLALLVGALVGPLWALAGLPGDPALAGFYSVWTAFVLGHLPDFFLRGAGRAPPGKNLLAAIVVSSPAALPFFFSFHPLSLIFSLLLFAPWHWAVNKILAGAVLPAAGVEIFYPPPAPADSAPGLSLARIVDNFKAIRRVKDPEGKPFVESVPLTPLPNLSRRVNLNVYLSDQGRQPTGSFKPWIMGWVFFLAVADPKAFAARFGAGTTPTTGNQGQSLARGVSTLRLLDSALKDFNAVIFVPRGAPPQKVTAMRRWGAEIREVEDYAVAVKSAEEFAAKERALYLAHGDANATESYGALALDMVESLAEGWRERGILPAGADAGKFFELKAREADLNEEDRKALMALDAAFAPLGRLAVVMPVGAGGLLAGVAAALKSLNPRVTIIGVDTGRVQPMTRALRGGGPESVPVRPGLLENGIGVDRPESLAVAVAARHVSAMVTLPHGLIPEGIRAHWREARIVSEGASVLPYLALLHSPDLKNLFAARGVADVVLISTGRNIEPRRWRKIVGEGGVLSLGAFWRLFSVAPLRAPLPSADTARDAALAEYLSRHIAIFERHRDRRNEAALPGAILHRALSWRVAVAVHLLDRGAPGLLDRLSALQSPEWSDRLAHLLEQSRFYDRHALWEGAEPPAAAASREDFFDAYPGFLTDPKAGITALLLPLPRPPEKKSQARAAARLERRLDARLETLARRGSGLFLEALAGMEGSPDLPTLAGLLRRAHLTDPAENYQDLNTFTDIPAEIAARLSRHDHLPMLTADASRRLFMRALGEKWDARRFGPLDFWRASLVLSTKQPEAELWQNVTAAESLYGRIGGLLWGVDLWRRTGIAAHGFQDRPYFDLRAGVTRDGLAVDLDILLHQLRAGLEAFLASPPSTRERPGFFSERDLQLWLLTKAILLFAAEVPAEPRLAAVSRDFEAMLASLPQGPLADLLWQMWMTQRDWPALGLPPPMERPPSKTDIHDLDVLRLVVPRMHRGDLPAHLLARPENPNFVNPLLLWPAHGFIKPEPLKQTQYRHALGALERRVRGGELAAAAGPAGQPRAAGGRGASLMVPGGWSGLFSGALYRTLVKRPGRLWRWAANFVAVVVGPLWESAIIVARLAPLSVFYGIFHWSPELGLARTGTWFLDRHAYLIDTDDGTLKARAPLWERALYASVSHVFDPLKAVSATLGSMAWLSILSWGLTGFQSPLEWMLYPMIVYPWAVFLSAGLGIHVFRHMEHNYLALHRKRHFPLMAAGVERPARRYYGGRALRRFIGDTAEALNAEGFSNEAVSLRAILAASWGAADKFVPTFISGLARFIQIHDAAPIYLQSMVQVDQAAMAKFLDAGRADPVMHHLAVAWLIQQGAQERDRRYRANYYLAYQQLDENLGQQLRLGFVDGEQAKSAIAHALTLRHVGFREWGEYLARHRVTRRDIEARLSQWAGSNDSRVLSTLRVSAEIAGLLAQPDPETALKRHSLDLYFPDAEAFLGLKEPGDYAFLSEPGYMGRAPLWSEAPDRGPPLLIAGGWLGLFSGALYRTLWRKPTPVRRAAARAVAVAIGPLWETLMIAGHLAGRVAARPFRRDVLESAPRETLEWFVARHAFVLDPATGQSAPITAAQTAALAVRAQSLFAPLQATVAAAVASLLFGLLFVATAGPFLISGAIPGETFEPLGLFYLVALGSPFLSGMALHLYRHGAHNAAVFRGKPEPLLMADLPEEAPSTGEGKKKPSVFELIRLAIRGRVPVRKHVAAAAPGAPNFFRRVYDRAPRPEIPYVPPRPFVYHGPSMAEWRMPNPAPLVEKPWSALTLQERHDRLQTIAEADRPQEIWVAVLPDGGAHYHERSFHHGPIMRLIGPPPPGSTSGWAVGLGIARALIPLDKIESLSVGEDPLAARAEVWKRYTFAERWGRLFSWFKSQNDLNPARLRLVVKLGDGLFEYVGRIVAPPVALPDDALVRIEFPNRKIKDFRLSQVVLAEPVAPALTAGRHGAYGGAVIAVLLSVGLLFYTVEAFETLRHALPAAWASMAMVFALPLGAPARAAARDAAALRVLREGAADPAAALRVLLDGEPLSLGVGKTFSAGPSRWDNAAYLKILGRVLKTSWGFEEVRGALYRVASSAEPAPLDEGALTIVFAGGLADEWARALRAIEDKPAAVVLGLDAAAAARAATLPAGVEFHDASRAVDRVGATPRLRVDRAVRRHLARWESFARYRIYVPQGLSVDVGGLPESWVSRASVALLEILSAAPVPLLRLQQIDRVARAIASAA